MADFNEQVTRSWDEWIEETSRQSGEVGEFVDWALSRRKIAARPQDIRQVLRKQVTQALRQAKRYDEDGGFTYRAKQSVTLFEDGIATKHYFDTDSGGTELLRQKSAKQRRDAIAHDVYRAVCDVEHMKKVFPQEKQLNFFTDFTDDAEELRAAEKLGQDREDDEDAA